MPKPLSKEIMKSLMLWQEIRLGIIFKQDPFGLTSSKEFSEKLLRVEFIGNGEKMQLNYYRSDPKDKKPINQDAYELYPNGFLVPIAKCKNPEHHLSDYPVRIKQALRNEEVLNKVSN